MKKLAVLTALAMVAASAQAAVVLWDDQAPVGGNMALSATTELAVSGSDTGHGAIGMFNSGDGGGNYRNYNIGGQDWSAYAGQDWTLSVDIYITAAQLADANIADDTIYSSVAGAPGTWVNISTFSAGWNTYTRTGTFASDGSTLTSAAVLVLNNSKGTNGALGSNYYTDNYYMEVVPEPATIGLVGAFGGFLLFVRRRFMI